MHEQGRVITTGAAVLIATFALAKYSSNSSAPAERSGVQCSVAVSKQLADSVLVSMGWAQSGPDKPETMQFDYNNGTKVLNGPRLPIDKAQHVVSISKPDIRGTQPASIQGTVVDTAGHVAVCTPAILPSQ